MDVTSDTIPQDQLRILLDNAEKTERQDRPTADSLEVVRRHGGFALRTPERFGGAWADAGTVTRRLAEVGRYCPSTAWIAGTCATGKTFVEEAFRDAVPPDVHADPDALACGSGRPDGIGTPEPGGIRINGRWPYVSGCEDAVWALLGLIVDGTFSIAVIPLADLSVERTWHSAGMRGTGSQTVVAQDLLVPAERVSPAGPPTPSAKVFYGLTVLAPVVGAARGALDVVHALFASDRKPFMTAYARMGDSPAARHWLAEATLLVDRAERTMLAAAQEVDAGDVSAAGRARLEMDLSYAARDCRAAVELMLDLHGPSGFATGNALQRYWRDIAVGGRHPHLRTYIATEDHGRALVAES
ncbi:acyl-CoA dehydrogenase family protein [Nonomuraea jabiensis]|uniref:Alkylation response protein AidB-like acyl-CoA dehydrogenase n=1 Tax=Nonomuraea jabiensis TaxID=882448 RepID=A0A7W9GK71_9ACTN|nr:acyl-CoA dehydrogenase family protein [Nonomuraea jabiensis]MBB5785198.1 alkylation response protein AidB-like acyl-CoA dehydrogenase [Nonomuraea jabiensis]